MEIIQNSHMVTAEIKDELAEPSMLELREQQIVAESEAMRQVLRTALKLARLNASNILLLGESGTGKGLLAKFIHEKSSHRKMPFVQINCAALPETLLETEVKSRARRLAGFFLVYLEIIGIIFLLYYRYRS